LQSDTEHAGGPKVIFLRNPSQSC